MGVSLDTELRSLLAYYGEMSNKPDALKPEDFFGLILTFSSSLQVCILFATLMDLLIPFETESGNGGA